MSELLEVVTRGLEHSGLGLVGWVVRMNLYAGLLLAAAMVADWAIGKRVAARWRILLYAAVLVRLALPAGPLWSVPGWTLDGALASVRMTSPMPIETVEMPGVTKAAVAGSVVIWPRVAMGVYLAGALGLAGLWARDAMRLRRVVARGEERGEAGGERLVISEDAGPMVVGVWCPRIVAPRWLTEDGEAMKRVLAHERAHLERRDPLLAAALRLACTAAWPVAGVWVAASRVRGLMEQACDERAIEQEDESNQESSQKGKEIRMRYAKTMVEVADRAVAMSAALGFGASLRARLLALRPAKRWGRAAQMAAAAGVSAVMLACSTAGPSTGVTTAEGKPLAAVAGGAVETKGFSLETRMISVKVLRGEPRAAGVRFESGVSVSVCERSAAAALMAPGSGGTVISSPTVIANVGSEAAVEIAEGDRRMKLKMRVDGTAPATLLAVSYEETNAGAVGASLTEMRVSYRSEQAVAIRIPPENGNEARVLVITVDPVKSKE